MAESVPAADPVTSEQSVANGVDETAAAQPSSAAAATAFGPPAAPGEVGTLGPYRVVKQLGAGGMGAVYLAFDTRLNRKLALKVMLPEYAANAVAKERFLREARAAAQITHDNIVTVYEADERDGVPYIAMQFLQGYPLDEYLKKKGLPSVPQVLRIARETAAGLAAAHKLGLVHRDIKPGNLWLEAPNGRVKVLDFGLAKPVDAADELTRSGAVIGTPAYMSPEQGRGQKVDGRSDLFSVGVMLYRLCTGELPFKGPTVMAVLMALGSDDPTPVRDLNPNVPEPLAELIHMLLAKNPADRPQTADAVVNRIRAIADSFAAPPSASGTQPQVMYVPIQITAQPGNSAFADLDVTAVEPAAAPAATAQPVRKKSGGKGMMIAAGLAVLLAAVVVAGVVIVIKNKDGTETKIDVPDGATVTVKDKGGKTLAQVKPDAKAPVADASPDRTAAEYMLSVGASVQVNGVTTGITAAADLPKDRFTLTGVHRGKGRLTDAGMAYLKDCENLIDLNTNGAPVTDEGLAHLKNCKALKYVNLGNTAVTEVGLVHLRDCKDLRRLELGNTRITDHALPLFAGWENLGHLHIGHTKITDDGFVHLKKCTSLTAVSINNTSLTNASLTALKERKNLTFLDVKMTKVTAKAVEEFVEALPRCKIEWDGGTIEPAKK